MKNLSLYRLAVVATALMAAGLAPRSGASTAGFATLLQFCAQGRPCPDGEAPYAGLLMDHSGNLYGTTQWGGARRRGTVFELALVDGEYTESVLYSFCSRGGKSCTDGQQPLNSLIMGPSGELYGTTFRGGDYGDGTVFQLSPAAASGPWTERVLYSFCAASGCSDGALPEAGLTANPSGELYGTTYGGGTGYDGSGVIFELVPNADKTKWAERVLYNFCSRGGNRCTDGGNPAGGVTTDASGNLYGQTERGGASGSWGTVYELIPNARAAKWAERALYRFCSEPADNCQSHVGEPIPSVTLIFDASGNLYGTTYFGGTNSQGTVYEPERRQDQLGGNKSVQLLLTGRMRRWRHALERRDHGRIGQPLRYDARGWSGFQGYSVRADPGCDRRDMVRAGSPQVLLGAPLRRWLGPVRRPDHRHVRGSLWYDGGWRGHATAHGRGHRIQGRQIGADHWRSVQA